MSRTNKSASGTAETESFSFETQQYAECMLGELESQRLEVCLIPQRIRTNEGGMIRVCLSKNPSWYQHFCAAYPSSRTRNNNLPDTSIRRSATVRALLNIIHGRTSNQKSDYVTRLLIEIETYRRKNKIPIASSNPF